MTGDIAWIKLSTGIFNDDKMKVILSMPDGEAIFNTWIRLLCLAGRINDNGHIYLSPGIAYSDDTLATVFNKSSSHIKLALETFRRLGIVTIVTSRECHETICITNWSKHQNVKGLDEIREATRIRNIEYRKRQKLQISSKNDGHVTSHKTSRVTLELELDKEKEKKPRKIHTGLCPKCGHPIGGHQCPKCDWRG